MGDAPRLKPRTVIEILDASFRIYRDNFALFLGILSVAYVPTMAIYLYAAGVAAVGVQEAVGDGKLDVLEMYGAGCIVLIAHGFQWVIVQMAAGALNVAVRDRYLGEEARLGRSYRALFKGFGRYLAAVIVSGAMFFLALMMCVVPYFILHLWFSVMLVVAALEGRNAFPSMRRSLELSRGHEGRALGLLLLQVLLWIAMISARQAALMWVIPHVTEDASFQVVLANAMDEVLTLFLLPFFTAAWVLFYFDLRIRKEGFDMEVMAGRMAAPAGFFNPGASPHA